MPSAPPLPTSLRTYRAVHPHDGELRRHDGCWSVRTPASPSFFWGNFLQFDGAPGPGDADRWPALFDLHLDTATLDSSHVALCWENGAAGDTAGFVQRGYVLHEYVVMVTERVIPAATPRVAASLRALSSDADWQALIDFNVRNRDEVHTEAGYRRYTSTQVAHWREQAAAGTGLWVGAFVGDALGSALGLYAERTADASGVRLARYQEVSTDARWRRCGLCSALLPYAAEQLAARGVMRYVIVSDEHDVARSVYAARGFQVEQRWRGLLRANARPSTADSSVSLD